jgi:cyclophilin family peptidyl-prolyl cis-trans isomerase
MTAFRTIKRWMVLDGAMLALLATGAWADDMKTPPPKPSVADIVKASKPADWRPVDPDNTLVMEIPSGRVVIEMAPTFAPNHVKNIKALVREHYFDGLAIIRSQDNWVVQWGDPDEDKNPRPVKNAQAKLKAEFTVPLKNDTQFTRLPDRDGYAPVVGHSNGFPVGHDPKKGRSLAGALLRHGWRGARQRRRQRRRHLAVRRDRPVAAPPGPQHHGGRPRRLRHAAAVGAAARRRGDGLLRQTRSERADQRGQGRGRHA